MYMTTSVKITLYDNLFLLYFSHIFYDLNLIPHISNSIHNSYIFTFRLVVNGFRDLGTSLRIILNPFMSQINCSTSSTCIISLLKNIHE